MEDRKRSHLLCLALVFLAILSDFSKAAEPKCRNKCTGSAGTYLQYEEGTTYVYNLEGNTETLVPKATTPNGDSTKLNIKAQVEVSVLPQCATLIKLKGVQVTGPDAKKYGNLNKLEELPLRVSLNGGKLDDEVCVDPKDDYTSVNIKRAVASFLQVNPPSGGGSIDELDVFGGCPTNYRVNKDGDSTIIQKHRNLNKCSYREEIRQELLPVTHAGDAELQTSPILDSQLVVEQRIKGGVLESVVAKESYLFRPFANRENGLRSRITTKLTLVSKSKGAVAAPSLKEPRSILFENPHTIVTADMQTVSAALHKTVDNMAEAVSPTSPLDFSNLVSLVRRASKDDLLSIYGQVKAGAGYKNKQLAKKVLTDALFRAGSADSVAVAIELLKSREIEGTRAKIWYLSFAFVRHASSTSLTAATSLLDEPNLPAEAYLGVGALANKYCREHVCENVPEFNELLSKLAKIIENPIPQSRDNENKIVGALKALRNIRRLNGESVNKVIAAISETKAPARVRAAALETAQSDACRGKIQKTALDILGNREEDSELRIKAYLVLIECPQSASATKVSELLDNEPVNQVGTFITSHLRNLRASANPDRQNAKQIYGNVKPKRKYPVDFRKFSQNNELSFNIDAINTAATIENNVIFSQNSYLPRQVSLNLTAEVFGHAFNFLELSGRAENLERAVERIFGPKGVVKSNKAEDLYQKSRNEIRRLFNRVEDKYKNIVRGKRSVTRDQTNAFASKVNLHRSELDSNVDLDLSVRILGNELGWININDNPKKVTADSVIDQIAAYIENGIGKTKNFNEEFKNHILFLDSELTYPTGTGFPLKLSATGSSIVHLKAAGNLDVAAALKNPKNAELKLTLIPSAAIEVVGEFTIDGYAVEAGIKTSATLHTATGTDITVKCLDGKGIDVNVGLPIKVSDIISVTTEVSSVVQERGHSQVNTPVTFDIPRKDYHGCFDQLSGLIGLTLCADIGYPSDQQPLTSNAALYPLNGHSRLSLKIDKEDESLKNYHFKYYLNKDDPKHRSLEVTIDTPGSNTNRKVSLLAEVKTEPNKEVNVQLLSPYAQLILQGQIIDTETEHSIAGKFKFNDNVEYSAKVGFDVNGATYTPVIQYKGTSGPQLNVQVDGTVTVDKKAGSPYRKYTFNNVRLTTAQGVYSIDGSVTRDVNLLASDLKLGYDKETIALKGKIQRSGELNLKVNAEILPSQFPDFGLSVKYEYQRDKEHIENSLVIVHGPDLSSKDHRLSLSQRTNYKIVSTENFDISMKNTLSYPLLKVDGKFEAAVTKKSVDYDLLLAYEAHQIRSKLLAKTSVNKPGDYQIDFSASAFERELAITLSREISAPEKSQFVNKVKLTPGDSYELIADVKHKFLKNDIEAEINSVLKASSTPNDLRFRGGLVKSPGTFVLYVKTGVGAENYVDAEYKLLTSGVPKEVSFTLNLRKVLESHGKFVFENGKGKGELLIDITRIKRKIKGDADITVAGNNYAGTVNLLLDADKDPNYKITITTNTDLTRTSINSKNTITALAKTLQVDFSGASEGTARKGKINGAFDITLPSGRNVLGSFKRGINIQDSALNLELNTELATTETKGGVPTKISLDYNLKDFTRDRGYVSVGSGSTTLVYSCPKGDARLSIKSSAAVQDGKYVIDSALNLAGSHIPRELNTKFHAVLTRGTGQVSGEGTLGGDLAVDVKYDYESLSQTKTLPLKSLNVLVNAKTPYESVKTFTYKRSTKYQPNDGVSPLQLSTSDEVTLNGQTYKVETDSSLAKRNGQVKVKLECPDNQPINSLLKYNYDDATDLRKGSVEVDSKQGDKVIVSLKYDSEYNKDLSVMSGHVRGQTGLEKLRNVDLQASIKKTTNTQRNVEYKLKVNEQSVEGSTKVDIDPDHPLIDIIVVTAAGKSRVYGKLERKGEKEATTEGQLLWTRNGGGQIDWSTHVDVQSVDNFIVTIRLNSEKLNLNKLKLEVGNRQTKAGSAQRINFAAQTADKKGFTGSATYNIKETENGLTVDGKGNINIKNENHPLTYKFVLKRLNKAADKEQGADVSLTVDYGKTNIIVKSTTTDKTNSHQLKYCKESECSELSASTSAKIENGKYTDSSHILIDNKLLGRKDYLKFDSATSLENGLFEDSDVLILQDRKYSKTSKITLDNAELILTTPEREIALLATYEIPLLKSKQKGPATGHGKLEITLYLDRKRNPSDKTNLLLVSDVKKSGNSLTYTSEARFSHPSLQKDLLVKGNALVGVQKNLLDASVEIDVFAKKNQKIVVHVNIDHDKIGANGHNISGKLEVSSKGLVLDIGGTGHIYAGVSGASAGSFLYYNDDKNVRKETGALIEITPTKVHGIVKAPSKTIARIDATIEKKDGSRIVNGEVSVGETNTIVAHVELKGITSLSGNIYDKAQPDKKLTGNVGINDKQLQVRAAKIEGGAETELLHGSIQLDEANFLKLDYDLNAEKIKEVVEHLRNLINRLLTTYKTLTSELSKEVSKDLQNLLDGVKKAQVNLKPLSQAIETQLKAIREELLNDKIVAEVCETLTKIAGDVTAAVAEFVKAITQTIEHTINSLQVLQDKIHQAVKKSLPGLEKAYEKLVHSIVELIQNLLQYGQVSLNKILDVVSQNKANIKEIISAVTDVVQDVGRLAAKTFNQIRHEITEFINVAIAQTKELPIYQIIQEKIEELKNLQVPDQIFEAIREVAGGLEDSLPTPELKALVKAAVAYIEKRLKREPVDDAAELRAIGELAVKALQQLLDALKQYLVAFDEHSPLGIKLNLPTSIPTPSWLSNIPKIGKIQISPLALLLGSDRPLLSDYVYTFRPTLNPLDYVPPYKAYALIVDSHHFLTFDRRHYSFKGSCSYILAQDFQDGNFSIVANLEGGKLKSITVNDKTDSVELLNDNTVTINGAASEYPVQHNDFNGWRRYRSVNLKNRAGLWIERDLTRDIWTIRVSGFYFGRTRGLLGTINNEQYDDFTLPNGHIAKDSTELVNAYKVVDSCPNTPTIPEVKAHTPECTDLFTSESPLRSGYRYINPDNYREACDQHAVNAPNKLTAACDIAAGYVAALREEHVSLSLPSDCVTCTINGKTIDLGGSASVVTPQGKKTDVVIVIQQSSKNAAIFQELVTPLIASLASTLGDVEVSIIGFGAPNSKWPQHFTNNGQLRYQGKSDKIVFKDGEASTLQPPYDTLLKKLDYVKRVAITELGLEQIVVAMNEANQYPFRVGASKNIILLTTEPCPRSPLFPFSIQTIRTILIERFYRSRGLNFFLVAPLDLAADAGKPLKEVVGFDSNHIYTLGETTKRDDGLVTYNSDLCIAFAQYHGGATFSSNSFLDLKGPQRKKYVQIVSQRIVKQINDHETTEDCQCRESGVVCKVISRDSKSGS